MKISSVLSKAGLALHPNQEIIFNSKARFRVVLAGRRFGKSYSAAAECLKVILTIPSARIWIIAPQHSQAREILRYLMQALETLCIKYDYSLMPEHRLKVGDCRKSLHLALEDDRV